MRSDSCISLSGMSNRLSTVTFTSGTALKFAGKLAQYAWLVGHPSMTADDHAAGRGHASRTLRAARVHAGKPRLS